MNFYSVLLFLIACFFSSINTFIFILTFFPTLVVVVLYIMSFTRDGICERMNKNIKDREAKVDAEYIELGNALNAHIDSCDKWPIVFNQPAEYNESYKLLANHLADMGFGVMYSKAVDTWKINRTLKIWPSEEDRKQAEEKSKETTIKENK